MPAKPPTRGNGSADVHIRPNPPSDVRTPHSDIAPHVDFGLPTSRPGGNPARPGRTTGDADLDAITSAPVVRVPETVGTKTGVEPPVPVSQPLEHYRFSTATALPEVNADGLRVHKGRRYVDLADGGIVLVGTDPATGLYRAKLSSELAASGPLLLRNTDSGRWHELEDFEPITFLLTDTRLEAFRTGLDFSDAEPGSDGLYRFDGKLYVEIEDHAYQVLHDPDASTPLAAVMRIVRSEDPVAGDNRNLYVATRPGRSEPIVFDAVQGWVGTGVAGAGGMMRGDGDQPARPGPLDRLSSAFSRLRSAESRARKLFPDHTDDQISDFIRSLGDDVRGSLTRRETEYKTLKAELKSWIKQSTTSSAPGTAKESTLRVAAEIKHCWRQQTGSTLRLAPGNETLPALKADFSHVRTLELDSITWSDSANTFLSGFSGLERLTVTHSTLEKLPATVATLHHLTALDLSSNRIQLDERAAANLSGLNRLEHLDLSGNPLGNTPDFSAMAGLKTLNLSNTRIDQWPMGLQHQSGLEIVDLRENHLSEVPEAILNPAADQLQVRARINGVTLLDGNPFAPGYGKSLELFWQRVAADHPELATSARTGAFRLDGDIPEIAMVQRMYPDKDVQAAKAYLMELDDAERTALARRVQEFDLLEKQLEEYVRSHNSTSAADDPATIWVQRVARTIRGCWLRDSGDSLKLPAGSGPLPALDADFSHVKSLDLQTIVWSDAADLFLSGFPNLEKLSITHSHLEKFPASVGKMHKLTRLDLSSNKIELDEHAAAKLSGLRQLSTCNLSNNPLKITPDFSAMPGLTSLNLRRAELAQWPSGLSDKATLTELDLRNNRLAEVPQALINPEADQLATTARINNITLLEGNAFPSGYWRKFDAYWRRVNAAHPELMDLAHSGAFDSDNSRAQRYRRIYPHKSLKECRDYLWNLEEGTAATRLNSLEREFNALKAQLDSWAFSGRGAMQRYVRAFELQSNAPTRSDRNTAMQRILSCWRRETPQKLANDGTPIGLELDLSHLTLPSLPDLDADFSHVGSLKLNSMHLSTSPEGFLTRYRHVRWLDMSNNQLRELPPALGEMNGLTRLFLQRNRIRLSPETAHALAGRTTLRALWLNGNPELGITPDFSQIPDMRSLDLSDTGIETFPPGLGEQPLLDRINLSGNRISAYPDSFINPPDQHLARTLRLVNLINLSNNPSSSLIQAQRRAFAARLREAGLLAPIDPIDTPPAGPTHAVIARDQTPVARWIRDLTASEVSSRTTQWHALHQQEGSDGFFNTLTRLLHNDASHADLQQRVWAMIDSMTENTPESESLRRELFDRAGEAGCCDRAAFTFSNLETRTLMHSARTQATDQAQGRQLSTLSRGLFRLHEVDKIASADIARSQAIVDDPAVPAEEKIMHRNRLTEEIEVRLAYRYGLKDRLQLPGQPHRAAFLHLGQVSKAMLDGAYEKVLALDNSSEEFQALVSREFWQEYVTHKYRAQFEAQRQPFQDRQATLDESFAAGELPMAAYEAQAKELQVSLAKDEATLIETLTRQELSEHPLTEPPAAGLEPGAEAAAQAQ